MQVRVEMHAEMLAKVPVFKNLEEAFLRMVAVKLKQQLCLEDDIVLFMGDIGNDMYVRRTPQPHYVMFGLHY